MAKGYIEGLARLVGIGGVCLGTFFGDYSDADAQTIGRLDVQNKLNDSNFGNHTHNLNYTDLSGASDGPDEFDVTYPGFPTPSPLDTHSKIISSVGSNEFETDVRELANETDTFYELSLITRSGSPVNVSSLGNELVFTIVDNTGFGSKDLYWRETDSLGNGTGPFYDIRDIIVNSSSVLTLPDLDGPYDSEDPYYYGKFTFTPEPHSLTLFGLGAAGLGVGSSFYRRRQRDKKQ